MKLVIRIGAAVALVALSACGQNGQEGDAENMDASGAMPADGQVLPIDDNATAGMDTLGNQLNQLNETGGTGGNTSRPVGGASANTAQNTSNRY
jgi:hypothetical protein